MCVCLWTFWKSFKQRKRKKRRWKLKKKSMIIIDKYSLFIRYRTLFSYKPCPMPNLFRQTWTSKIQNLDLF
jgi:hypothetical protein